MTKSKTRSFLLLNVIGECDNRVAGQLVHKYINGEATPEENREFREHLLGCLCCAATVANMRTMSKASKHYGIPPGPELDQYLASVTLEAFPEKYKGELREINRGLMAIKQRRTIN